MNTMIPATVQDLDQLARTALRAGYFSSLDGIIRLTAACHPGGGFELSRTYEGDTLRLICSLCGRFAMDVKVANE